VAASRPLLSLALVLAAVATLLMLNGLFFGLELPLI